ncbi:hypothetical protein LX32DRAFT_260997 [Colletotrichum zoysiae]|uniref:Uncharacterized protein n=1 Tax=Colletotrichum zoysiae TaxID=1216348 RepID=A0AAD9H325_9PEZI|nr:hypothetical protein LX32DRAFT_260997 [Colletotrichum zoysiae]
MTVYLVGDGAQVAPPLPRIGPCMRWMALLCSALFFSPLCRREMLSSLTETLFPLNLERKGRRIMPAAASGLSLSLVVSASVDNGELCLRTRSNLGDGAEACLANQATTTQDGGHARCVQPHPFCVLSVFAVACPVQLAGWLRIGKSQQQQQQQRAGRKKDHHHADGWIYNVLPFPDGPRVP